MSTTLTRTAEGACRKLSAFALLAARREALIRRGRRALLSVLIERAEATADDVRELVPLPPGINAKAFGAVPSVLAEAGIIVADGFAKSVRPKAHARPVQRWRLADREAALRWLDTHAEIYDVEGHDADDGGFGTLFSPVSSPQKESPAATGLGKGKQ